ncbi:MAG: class I SAM-dependent methyltransferase [Silvanigrellales bacterium]|nr:class I SAM-dependent methyltransferase [Silvanigrellales bacterium]
METPSSPAPAAPDSLRRMRLFYNLFPYPNRAVWSRPDPSEHLVAHAGFARLLARGDATLATSLWRRSKGVDGGLSTGMEGEWAHASPRTARDLAQAHTHFESLFGEAEHVALVGCGTDEPLLMRLLHPRAKLEALDLSARSLGIARWKECLLRISQFARLRRPRKLGSTRYVCADAARHLLEGNAERFTHIQCFGVLHHQKDPWRMFAGLARALKRGGTLRLMVYSHHGRRLERRIQGRYERLWEEVTHDPLALARLFCEHAKLHFWQIFQFLLGNGGASLRFRYLGLSSASVADALLHPSDPGLPLEDVRKWAVAHGLRLVFCEAKFDDDGWQAGFGHTPETAAAWRKIEAADTRDALLSNVVAIFLKP